MKNKNAKKKEEKLKKIKNKFIHEISPPPWLLRLHITLKKNHISQAVNNGFRGFFNAEKIRFCQVDDSLRG